MSESTVVVVNTPEPEPEPTPDIHVEVIVPETPEPENMETHCEHCTEHAVELERLRGEVSELRNAPPVVIEVPPEIEPEPEPEPEHHEPDSAPKREHVFFADHPFGS